ncbi:MAG: DinB family protein [Chloroflexi bacterium]|nr:DinB family protein [Chloroflexota bacterium]
MENTTAIIEAQARRLEKVCEQLTAELQQPGVMQRLRNPAGENEWSAMQILGHLVEMIPYWLGHCRALIAEDGQPPQFGRTLDAPERLEGVERGATGNPGEAIRWLKEEVRSAAGAIRAMSATERGKKGIHIRRGEMTVADIIEVFIVSHAEDHLAQVRQTLQAVIRA